MHIAYKPKMPKRELMTSAASITIYQQITTDRICRLSCIELALRQLSQRLAASACWHMAACNRPSVGTVDGSVYLATRSGGSPEVWSSSSAWWVWHWVLGCISRIHTDSQDHQAILLSSQGFS